MPSGHPFDELIALVKQKAEVEFSIEQPFKAEGNWWLELAIDGWRTSVVWRSRSGFGLFTSSDDLYGQRPDEIFSDVTKTAIRLLQAARHQAADEALTMTLKDVRLILGETQQNLAQRLMTGQAEISRLESRDDTHVERFRSYVEALGGKLELTVTFPDFKGPVALPSPEKEKPKRAARSLREKPAHA